MPSDSIDEFVVDCLKRLVVYRCNDQLQLAATLQSIVRKLEATESGHSAASVLDEPRVQLIVVEGIGAFYWLARSHDRVCANECLSWPNETHSVLYVLVCCDRVERRHYKRDATSCCNRLRVSIMWHACAREPTCSATSLLSSHRHHPRRRRRRIINTSTTSILELATTLSGLTGPRSFIGDTPLNETRRTAPSSAVRTVSPVSRHRRQQAPQRPYHSCIDSQSMSTTPLWLADHAERHGIPFRQSIY